MTESDYQFVDIDQVDKKPNCQACGDPVKIVFHDGKPRYAQHCHECYAELRWGKVPPSNLRKKSI